MSAHTRAFPPAYGDWSVSKVVNGWYGRRINFSFYTAPSLHCLPLVLRELVRARSTNSSPCVFFFSSRRRHTRYIGDWSSDVCSSDLFSVPGFGATGSFIGGGSNVIV